MEDGYCTYAGETISTKAFVVDDKIQLEALKGMILERFKINQESSDLVLGHMHPFQKLTRPFIVDTEEDFRSFVDINESPKVSWTFPLYVSSNMLRSKKVTQRLTQPHSLMAVDVDNDQLM